MRLKKTTALLIACSFMSTTPAMAQDSEKITLTATPTTKSNSELECLVKVMNHEAGGEGIRGQKAVGYVVMNRTKSGKFPSSVCGVIYQKSQFSNITRAKAIPVNKYNALKSVAQDILSGYSRINDPTSGSLYFHNVHVFPNWRNLVRTVQIGGHIFFRAG